MKSPYHPTIDQITLAGVLYALGDPTRLEIVQLLSKQEEQPCNAVSCDLAKSTLSHHYKVLRESGVIYSSKSGTQRLNSLRRDDLEQLFPGLLDAILNQLK